MSGPHNIDAQAWFKLQAEAITGYSKVLTIGQYGGPALSAGPYLIVRVERGMHMEQHTGFLILLATVLALFFGVLLRHLLKNIALPYTVSLLVIGLAMGLMHRGGLFQSNLFVVGQSVELVAAIDPHLIMFLFLPTLIFESAFALETHLFRRAFVQIAILAVPGLIVSTILTALLAMYLFPWTWSWPVALLFGALISATDPVAVVALLKELSSRKRLETLIEGESLLNDGTAIVFFALFFHLIVSGQEGGGFLGFLPAIGWKFVLGVGLGVMTGLVFGFLAIWFIGKVFQDAMVEITVSIVVAYLAFMVAEALFHVSGVVAVVTLALLLASVGRTRISPEIADFLRHFWEMMAYIANTLIFLLVGIIIALRVRLDSPSSWLALLILFIGILVIRAISISLFLPLLQRIGLGITREKAIVLIWGGLRGAVALALALVVAQDHRIATELGDQILFLTAGVVVLTLLINGTSMQMVLRRMGMDTLPLAKQTTVDRANEQIRQEMLKLLPQMRENEFFQAADWDLVQANIGVEGLDRSPDALSTQAGPACELEWEFKRRLLEAERSNYWLQFRQGGLGGTATHILIDAVEKALDGTPSISPRPLLHRHWNMPAMTHWLKRLPMVKDLAVRVSFDRMALGYDVARGFIFAQNASLEMIDKLSPAGPIAADVKEEIMQNKSDTYARIEHLRHSFPEVIVAIETRAASRSLLNRQRSVIETLIGSGFLDTAEADRMLERVDMYQLSLRKTPARIDVSKPETLFIQLPWLESVQPETIEGLLSVMDVRIYDAGEVLLNPEESGRFLVVISRGVVALISRRNEHQELNDIRGPGSVFGMAELFPTKRKQSIRTQSPVEALWFDAGTVNKLLNLDQMFSKNLTRLFTG